ncbi:Fe(3+)-hydroxamate ABC transporter permease FhuB, partial [Enterobacter intestinihominis]
TMLLMMLQASGDPAHAPYLQWHCGSKLQRTRLSVVHNGYVMNLHDAIFPHFPRLINNNPQGWEYPPPVGVAHNANPNSHFHLAPFLNANANNN